MLIPLGILAGQGEAIGEFFIALYGDDDLKTARELYIDDSAIYLIGADETGPSSTFSFICSKFSYAPAAIFQKQLNFGGESNAKGGGFDSSGNVYISGSALSSFRQAKYNSIGTLQWARTLSGGSSIGTNGAVNAGGDFYVFGYSNQSGVFLHQVAKYNTSGTIQWQRRFGSTNSFTLDGVVDSSGDLLLVGDSGAGMYKFDSSGSLVWQRKLSAGAARGAAATDSTKALYAVTTGNNLVKRDTSGSIVWQRNISTPTAGAEPHSIATDSLDNVYLLRRAGADMYIIKFDSAGNTVWQRAITVSGTGLEYGSTFGAEVRIDSGDRVVVSATVRYRDSGFTLIKSKVLLARIPADGSLTQSVTIDGAGLDYRVTTDATITTSTLTSTTPTDASTASSLTSSTASPTEATPNYPIETRYIK
jgi:hypothetical protein